MSRHLPEAALTSAPPAFGVHSCAAVPLQPQICTLVLFLVPPPLTSRHRPSALSALPSCTQLCEALWLQVYSCTAVPFFAVPPRTSTHLPRPVMAFVAALATAVPCTV